MFNSETKESVVWLLVACVQLVWQWTKEHRGWHSLVEKKAKRHKWMNLEGKKTQRWL